MVHCTQKQGRLSGIQHPEGVLGKDSGSKQQSGARQKPERGRQAPAVRPQGAVRPQPEKQIVDTVNQVRTEQPCLDDSQL